MEFTIEKVADFKDEIQPLLEMHWEQIALNKDKIKLNPAWDQYITLNENGVLFAYIARDKGILVGYFIVIVMDSLHYVDHKFATCDIIFVHPDHRKGMVGYKLIRFAEEHLKKLGVSCIHINTKIHAPFDKLLEKMQYNCIERIFSKYIGK